MNLQTVMGCAKVFGQTRFPFLSICIRLHHCLSQLLFYFLPQIDRTMSQPCWLGYICLEYTNIIGVFSIHLHQGQWNGRSTLHGKTLFCQKEGRT